jgi:hypothetical protein
VTGGRLGIEFKENSGLVHLLLVVKFNVIGKHYSIHLLVFKLQNNKS